MSAANLLAGLRVVDLSMFVAGPFATALLADLGASVVKIEPPGGDPVRNNRIGPRIGGESAQFQTYNHGKQSIVLDLKSEAGRMVLFDLAREADVVFDNFRPGVTARLGIDHAALAGFNPRIVTVSLSAFGESGPWVKRPGYDLIVQALSGAMSINGHAATGPAHIPFHIGDTAGGLYAAIAILAAVSESRRTGVGRAIEVSMLDAQFSLLGDEITNFRTGEWQGEPHGAGHPALAPYAAYGTADRPIAIAAVGTEKFWHGFVEALEAPELASDPRFADNGARCRNRAALDETIGAILRGCGSAEWLDRLAAHDVPAAPVLSLGEAIASPHAAERHLIAPVPVDGETAYVPRAPIRLRGETEPPPLTSAPCLGADAAAVLQDLAGYSPERLTELAAAGAFGPPEKKER